jgi:hypothetical protein
MTGKRPNIGSRVNREVHARFWERSEVKFLRATRPSRHFAAAQQTVAFGGTADIESMFRRGARVNCPPDRNESEMGVRNLPTHAAARRLSM